jgi:hypothetical protein
MPKAKPKRKSFVITPFAVDTRREIVSKSAYYRETKRLTGQLMGSRAERRRFIGLLKSQGIAEEKKYGLVIKALPKLSEHPEPPLRVIGVLLEAQHPELTREAQLESIRIIRQLRGLGHWVGVQRIGERDRKAFIRLAQRAGATITKCPAGWKAQERTYWARDQWVKIGMRLEAPQRALHQRGVYHAFGEGGTMVQVGPREFAVYRGIAKDPRLAKYQRGGYKFELMPEGIIFERVLSDLLGTRVYSATPHIDLSIGAVPEKRVVGVDPNYYSDNKASVERMVKNFKAKLVQVPREEADRHPANFLLLGNGKVLVDSGAKRFIQMLEGAGVTVVPTAVPLNALISLKGGLRCLFNEK